MPVDVTANYIRIRVASPKKFVRMRIKLLGKGIKAVVGFLKGGGSEIQSFLFPKSSWTVKQAKAWIKSHDYKVHETWLVTDIIVGPDFIEFQETLLTSTIEQELDLEWIKKAVKSEKKWEWLLNG